MPQDNKPLPPPPPQDVVVNKPPPPPPPQEEEDKGILKTIDEYAALPIRGALSGVFEDLPKLAGAGAKAIGLQQLGEGLAGAGEYNKEVINKVFPTSPEAEQSLGGQFLSAAGAVVPMIASGGASTAVEGLGLAEKTAALSKVPTTILGEGLQAAKIGAKTLTSPAGVLGGAMLGVPEYEAAKQAGKTDDEAFNVLLKNYLIGTASAAPIEGALMRLNNISQGTVAKYAASGLHSALTMGSQKVLTNNVAKSDYDPDRDPFWGVAQSMLVGGAIGLLMPGIHAAMGKATPENRVKIEKKVAELESKAKAIESADKALDGIKIDPKLEADLSSDATLSPEELKTISDKKITDLQSEEAIRLSEERQKEIDQIEKDLEKHDTTLEKNKQKIEEQPKPEKGAKPEPKGTLLPEQKEEMETRLEELKTEATKPAEEPNQPDLHQEAKDKIDAFVEAINAVHKTEGKEPAANGDRIKFDWLDGEKEGKILDEKSPHGYLRVRGEDGIIYPIEPKDIKDVMEKGKPVSTEGEANEHLKNLYSKLQEAKAALRKIAPQAKPKGNPELDKALGIAKPEKTVKMTPGEAIKYQVQTFYRGVKEGVTRGKNLTNELVKKVQESLKEQKGMTARQVSTILTKVRNTNLFTAGSVSRLNDFITKVSADAAYAEKLGEANELRDRIKGKRNAEGATGKEKDVLNEFSKIDPSHTDVDKYLERAREINRSFRPVTDRAVIDQAKAWDYINETRPDMEAAEAQREQDRAEREQERAQNLADKLGLTFEEGQELLQGETPLEENITAQNKKAEVHEALMSMADEARQNMPEVDGLSDNQNKDVETIKNADLSLLSPDQLKAFIKSIDRISVNKDFGFTGRLTSIIKSAQDFKLLKEKLGDSHIIKLLAAEKWLNKNLTSLPVFIRNMFGGISKDASTLQEFMGINGANKAHVEAKEGSMKLAEDIKELANKSIFGRKHEGFTTESVWRQTLFGELIKTPEGEDAVQWLEDTKKVIEQDIQNRKAAGFSDQAKIEQKLYDDFKKAGSVEEVMSIMKKVDPTGYKVIVEKAVAHFEKVVNDVVDSSERYHGKVVTKQKNYSGPRVWNSIGANADTEVMFKDALGDVGGYSRSLPKPKLMHSAKDVNNQPRRDALLNLNKHSTMINGLENAIFNSKAVDYQIRVRENISRRAELEKLFGSKEGDDSATQNARELYATLFGNRGLYDKFEKQIAGQAPKNPNKILNEYLEPLRKIGYQLSLGGVTQYVKQMAVLSNVISRIGIDKLPIREMIKDPEAARKFFAGNTVALRGAQQSQFSLGHVDVPETGAETKNVLQRFGDRGFTSLLGTRALIRGDVHAAQLSYGGFYKAFLEENGQQWQGFAKEAELKEDPLRREAHAYAKQKVDELQGVSNPAEMATWLKSQESSAQLMKSALIPFGSFSVNTKGRMYNDFRILGVGDRAQRMEAAKDLVATAIEQTTFNGLSLGIKAMMLTGAHALAVALGLPEKTKKIAKKEWDNMVNTFTVNLTKDLLPIILVKPIEQAGAEGVNTVASIKKVNQWLHDSFGKQKKGPLINTKLERKPTEALLDDMGVLGVGIQRFTDGLKLGTEIVTKENEKGQKLTPEQERFAAYVGFGLAANMGGYFPSDLLFPLKHELQVTRAGVHQKH